MSGDSFGKAAIDTRETVRVAGILLKNLRMSIVVILVAARHGGWRGTVG
jgi:hypothetical protein